MFSWMKYSEDTTDWLQFHVAFSKAAEVTEGGILVDPNVLFLTRRVLKGKRED